MKEILENRRKGLSNILLSDAKLHEKQAFAKAVCENVVLPPLSGAFAAREPGAERDGLADDHYLPTMADRRFGAARGRWRLFEGVA